MKKLLFIISIIPVLALGQSTDQNFVKSTTYKVATTTPNPSPDADEAVVQITYFDGLGRPIQQIAHKQSNTGKDIVTHIEYDQFGRQTKEFLPYATTAPSLSYIDAPTAIGDLNAFYTDYNGGTSNPFSEKLLESSPLSRVFKQAAPGDAWAMGSGKEIKFDYQTNESSDDVKLFKAVANWNSTNKVYDFTITDLGTYANNQLYKTITKDENWTSGNNNTTEEFKDKEGRVVLKRTFSTIMQSGTILEFAAKHDTYYIYDQYGNLTAVLPPLAEGSASQVNLDELGYQYKYDSRNRLVEKKLPGKQWEFIVYDNLDRPIATGPVFTPYGGSEIGWMITEYDVFGRVTQTGWKEMAVSETERRSNQESVVGGTNPFTLGTDDILTKNYYDNYSYPNAPTLPSDVEGQTLASNVRGLPTGSWVKVLDSNNPLAYEESYTLYDNRYRPVSSYTQNYLGGFTQVDSKLDWAGKTLYTVTTHTQNQYSTPIVITDTFEYTQQDRLQTHKQQINQLDEQLISANTYDELGQLISKNVGGDYLSLSALQKVDYTYNIRGWLKAINDIADITTENDLFAFKINYNDPSNAQALFNGNISEIFWKTDSDNTTRKYEFKYDHLNRLLEANYKKPDNASTPNNFKEHLNYDKNGNITQLQRNGDLDSDGLMPAMPIDDLTYTYHPQKANQLMKVVDDSGSPQGFKDGINSNDDYTYDANGNMTVDQNKGITNIKYNHLNLPTEVEFGVTGKIEYLYNATGQKVAKIVTEGSNITQHDYLAGGFQYKNSALQFFPHAEGYVNATQTRGGYMFNYVFNYTDHLGNIRVSYGIDPSTATLKIIEENHYYPFGLKHTNYNSDQYFYIMNFEETEVSLKKPPTTSLPTADYGGYKYKYNGKEYQDELGLNMYDYGARNYDPALGRWMNIDPLAEKMRRHSSYNYCFNNPVYFVDPDGMAPEGGDPPFGFRLGFNLGVGSKGVNFNVTASVGVEHRTPNFQAVAFASATVYGGEQVGTSSMTSGLQYDFTAGGYASVGSGSGSPHNFYTLNYNTASPFSNTFDTSFSYGQARTFNSAINAMGDGPGWQTQGIVGARFGENFSFSSNNDANSYGTSLIFNDTGSDAGWTGGIVFNAGGVEAGYQNFSGYWPEFGTSGTEFGYQFSASNRMGTGENGDYHQSLNNAFNFVRTGNFTGGVFSGAWFQNAIHQYFSDDGTYIYNNQGNVNTNVGQ